MIQQGQIIWFTGLSGAGKSTLASNLQRYFIANHLKAHVLDGDVLRQNVSRDLGFSAADRTENIRRSSYLACELSDKGEIVICALITPTENDRNLAKAIIGSSRFHLVYIQADIETCAARDPKGLYQQALHGLITEFTGISAPFEEPLCPSLIIDTRHLSLQASLVKLTHHFMPLVTPLQVSCL